MASKNKIGAAIVVGGGIGGIQAALDLAELGYKTYLVEKKPSIGGVMSQLDKTFPTNDCSLCILAPKMVEVARHPNVELLTYSEIQEISGEAGNFNVKILKKSRYVDIDKCTGCGACSEKCPMKKIPSKFDEGMGNRPAIYIPFPQAVPRKATIDAEKCLYLTKRSCQLCLKECEAEAIDFDMKDEEIELNVGAIILSLGATTFDPSILLPYGYGKFKNVITSIQFERILNAAGPSKGEVIRLSDGKHPKKILWINCIGSRNVRINRGYCSSVCCMYSIKQAVIAKEHDYNIDCKIFFIDMRTTGKGFEEYYLRAEKSGIKFLKGRISLIKEDPESKSLITTYEDIETGGFKKEIFDLVVLSVGLTPSDYSFDLSKKLQIDLNDYNFCNTGVFTPLETNKSGIFVCGTYSGPKDIPETVAEASGAAGRVSSLLFTERNTLITTKEYPPEKSVKNQEPRIGAFICHCGKNIGNIVNVQEVVKFVKSLPYIVYAEGNLFTCSQDSQNKIEQIINDYNLNRVVIASCTPRTHEFLFQNTIREAGLNPYLFEFVNIREQCSWVHMNEPEKATEKAKELLAMGVAKARLLEPIYKSIVDVTNTGLVIGGGVAGMTAALELANQGYEVFLIEKEKELGGFVRHIHYLLEGDNPHKFLKNLISQVKSHDKIKLFTNAKITDIEGVVGNFLIYVDVNGNTEQLETGIIIVATGGIEYKPKEFLYGQHESILTQHELEQKIYANDVKVKNIVMIQCVGSRNGENPNCSKICCFSAIKNSLKLKEMNPHSNIIILHKDIRTYGFKEDYYRKAREKGIIFIRYNKKNEPKVSLKENKLIVNVYDLLLNDEITINPDLIVLSAGLLPRENKELSQLLKVPLDQNGFFLEAHVKLRPLDFASDGIFLCGTAQWPKSISETIVQAKGAAARALIPLMKGKAFCEGAIAQINENLCIGCDTCINICPFNAIYKTEEEEVVIHEVLCKGCGICGASCPENAITINHFTNDQIISQFSAIEESKEPEFEPKILGFLCNWCSYAGADLAGVSRVQYKPNIRVVRVMCSGRVDPIFIAEAFLRGIDGVLVLGCHLGDCHYISGNYEAEIKMNGLLQLLELVGFSERLHLDWVSASEGVRFGQVVDEFTEHVHKLGPSPVKDEKIKEKVIDDLNAVKSVLSDSRFRALVAKERRITSIGNAYDEIIPKDNFEEILEDAIYNEFIRQKILEKIKDQGKSVPEISKEVNIEPNIVLHHIVTLRSRGLVDLEKITEDIPTFVSIKE